MSPPRSSPPDSALLAIDGRTWRRSDPAIPPLLRQALVNELMAARRAIRDSADDAARRTARRRVQDAKVALGERGPAWWEDVPIATLAPRIDGAIRALLRSRRPGATICPSEAARVAGGARWRQLLPLVRARAAQMAADGDIDILRGGVRVTAELTAGVLRYRSRELSAAAPPSGAAPARPSHAPR